MSFLDKVRSLFTGGSSAPDAHAGHDHSGHDHDHDHDHDHSHDAPAMPADPVGTPMNDPEPGEDRPA